MRRRGAALAVSFLLCSCTTLFAQSKPLPAPTPAPVQIEDTALRQVTPAPQTVPQPDKSLVIRPEWLAHHEKNLIEARSGPHDLVFVGDSITDNYHKFGPAPDQVFKPIWDKYFAPHSALNLGVSGDSTQHVLWRLEHGEVDGLSPSNVVLLIGTNNTWHDSKASAGDVTSGVEAVVKELHTRLPEAKILVIGILPTTVSTAKSSKDAEINRNLGVFYADSSFARVLDLSPLFLNPDGTVDESLFYDMPAPCKGSNCDANAPLPPRKVVHPNTVGQTRMAEAISRALFP